MPPSPIDNLARSYHTVRHMKPEQVMWRAWYRLYRPRPDLAPAPPLRATAVKWEAPIAKAVSMTGPNYFRFHDLELSIASPDCWDNAFCDRLWLYNLQYFDDLNAREAEERLEWHRRLIHRWVAESPPGSGTGWEPYPTALRIVNWIKWGLAGNGLHAKWRDSLAIQARWLVKRLERHLPGNRLLVEAKALVFAGLFFEGQEPRNWLHCGLAILAREIPEQILPDGGHFERSPMVHARTLENLLDLINLSRAYADAVPAIHRPFLETWPDIAARMHRYLALMCHPDGRIAFFNDAATGIAPSSAELEQYAARLQLGALDGAGEGLIHLGDTGYIRMADKEAVALLDVAPIGPDFLTGHAHADTLSFELSLYGRCVLVNSGTSEYVTGAERRRQRGTPAHNTVTVNDTDSSEVWRGYRVGRRARPFGLWVEDGKEAMKVSCSHDGYHRLTGRVIHRRFWQLAPGELRVTDTVEGHFKTARAHFHFHPGIEIKAYDRGFSAYLGEGRRLNITVDGGTARLRPSTWHPAMGASVPNQRLEILFRGAKLETVFSWQQKFRYSELGL